MPFFSLALAVAGTAALPCSLTAADRAANATLSFDDFDQGGNRPSTFRALAERECYRQAGEAMEDYLVNGPPRSERRQRILTWHLAQSLALAGDEGVAATVMASAHAPTDDGEREWNRYVEANRSFLRKDRPAFDRAATALAASADAGDRINSALVAGLGRCWTKPYRVAFDRACGIAATPPAPRRP